VSRTSPDVVRQGERIYLRQEREIENSKEGLHVLYFSVNIRRETGMGAISRASEAKRRKGRCLGTRRMKKKAGRLDCASPRISQTGVKEKNRVSSPSSIDRHDPSAIQKRREKEEKKRASNVKNLQAEGSSAEKPFCRCYVSLRRSISSNQKKGMGLGRALLIEAKGRAQKKRYRIASQRSEEKGGCHAISALERLTIQRKRRIKEREKKSLLPSIVKREHGADVL